MQKLYMQQVRQDLLNLYETLVRHDENVAAYVLLQECVPWFLVKDQKIANLRVHQRKVTEHLRDNAIYEHYYGNNPHELPFEEMFGCEVDEMLEQPMFLRIKWLLGRLRSSTVHSALDLACNDGAIAAFLTQELAPDFTITGYDLNPTCVERARARGVDANVGNILTMSAATPPVDAVIAMEVIEHVPDPIELLSKLGKMAPLVYITCPLGSTDPERDEWMQEEYKGHVRAIVPDDLIEWADPAGLVPLDVSIAGGYTICAEFESCYSQESE
jgi:SAM-dependent methyltransferase